MSIRARVVHSFQLGLKPYHNHVLLQMIADKHTSAVTDKFKENKHAPSKTSLDESLKNQIELESKFLKEMLLTKDALINSKDALINSKDALINSKDALIESQSIIRSYLETELLAIKHKLHCRGVIERFEILRSSGFTGQPKITRSATWIKILDNDINLQKYLCQLKGFPPSVAPSSLSVVTAKLVTEFYRRLSNDIHRDSSGQTLCLINKHFCSEWETHFMVKICDAIPVLHKVVNEDELN